MTAAGKPTNADKEGGQNVHILAIKLAYMVGEKRYAQLMDEMVGYVLSSSLAAGSKGPMLPGRMEWDKLVTHANTSWTTKLS